MYRQALEIGRREQDIDFPSPHHAGDLGGEARCHQGRISHRFWDFEQQVDVAPLGAIIQSGSEQPHASRFAGHLMGETRNVLGLLIG